jgi:hypothetical protein
MRGPAGSALTTWTGPNKRWLSSGLPSLIAASGLHVEHTEPGRSVAHIADAALIATKSSASPGKPPDLNSRAGWPGLALAL